MMVEKDELIETMQNHYTSSRLQKIGWDKLSDKDMQVMLNIANDKMNRLQYIGEKVDESQSDAWPRIIGVDSNGNQIIMNVPPNIKLAFASYIYEYMNIEENVSIADVLNYGITSSKAGPISENYDLKQITKSLNKYKLYLQDVLFRGV